MKTQPTQRVALINRFSPLSFLILLLLSLAGCATPRTVDYDRAMLPNMQAYQSFQLENRDVRASYQNLQLTEITDRRISRSITNQLTTQGFTQTDTNPDCIVTYFTTSRTRTKVNNIGVAGGYGYGYGYSPYNAWSGYSHIDIDQYEEGTLIIDIIDAKTKQMVWRGADSKRLQHRAPTEKEINQIVERILREFPPQPAG